MKSFRLKEGVIPDGASLDEPGGRNAEFYFQGEKRTIASPSPAARTSFNSRLACSMR